MPMLDRITENFPLRSKMLTGASLVLSGTVAHGLTRVLLNLLAGRALGPADFGQLTLCLAIAQFSALLWPTSLGAATAKYVAAQPTEELETRVIHQLERWANWGALGASIIAGIAWLVVGSQSWLGVAVTALVCFAYSEYHFSRGLLLGKRQFARSTALEVLLATTALVGGVIALALADSGLYFALCLASGFAVYAAGRGLRRARKVPISRELRRDVRKYISIGTVGTIASSGFLQLSVVAASHWGGATGVGNYGAALALATPASIFAVSLGSALLPSLSSAHAQGGSAAIARATDRATRGINVVAVCVFGSMVILAGQLTSILWGPQFLGSTPVLRVLLIATLLTSCAVPCVTRLSATSTHALALATRTSIGGVIVSAALWVPLGDRLGVTGIAWGYLIGATGTAATLFVTCWRRDRQNWGWLSVCTAGAFAILVGVAGLNPSLDPLTAAASAAAFAATYVTVSLLPRFINRQRV